MSDPGFDAAARCLQSPLASMRRFREYMNIAGLALRDDKKLVDKTTKGTQIHA